MSSYISFNYFDGYLFNQIEKVLIAKFESIQSVTSNNDLFIVSKRKASSLKYGVYDAMKKRCLIDCIYDQLEEVSNSNNFIVKIDKKFGVINLDGNTTVPIKYDGVSIGIEVGMYICKNRSKYELFYAHSGKHIKVDLQEVITDINKSKFFVRRGLKWGVFDFAFKEIVSFKYDSFIAQDHDFFVFRKNNELHVFNNNDFVFQTKGEKFIFIKQRILVTKSKNSYHFRNLQGKEKSTLELDYLDYSEAINCFVYGKRKYVRNNQEVIVKEVFNYGVIEKNLSVLKELAVPDFVDQDVDSIAFYLNLRASLGSQKIITLKCVGPELAVVTTEKGTLESLSLINLCADFILRNFESTDLVNDAPEDSNSDLFDSLEFEYELEDNIEDYFLSSEDAKNKMDENESMDYTTDSLDDDSLSHDYNYQHKQSPNNNGQPHLKEFKWSVTFLVPLLMLFLLFLTVPDYSDFKEYAKHEWVSEFYEVGKQSDDELVSGFTRLVELSGVLSATENMLWDKSCFNCLSFKNYWFFVIGSVDMPGHNRTYVGLFGSFYKI